MAKARAKAKQEEEKKLKRDVFFRELRMCQLSASKREKEWKKMLMKIAVPQMREQLEFAWISFERAMDIKDMTITVLKEELDDAEEQYSMNFENHMEHINEAVALFQEIMDEMKTEYNNKITTLETGLNEDLGGLIDTWKEDEEFLKTLQYMLDLTKKDDRDNMRADFFLKLEEQETKKTQILQRLEIFKEETQSAIENEFNQLLNDYESNVNRRKNYYDELKTQDESLRDILSLQREKIQEMYVTIKRQKEIFEDNECTLQRKISDLEQEWQFYSNALSVLKKRLEDDRALDARKLQILTVSHNKTVKHLEKISNKGEHILQIAAVCRKLETQEEKILSFPCEHIINDLRDNIEVEYFNDLDLFWQKVAQAEASKYALVEEREFLLRENELLQKELHEYCQCLNCPQPQTNANLQLNWHVCEHKSRNVTEGISEQKRYAKQNISFQ